MNKSMRHVLRLLLLTLSAACHAASPHDTLGPFVQYGLGADGTDNVTHFVSGSTPVSASGTSVHSSEVRIHGQGGRSTQSGLTSTGAFAAAVLSGWSDDITFHAGPGVTEKYGIATFQLQYDWNATINGAATGNHVYAAQHLTLDGLGSQTFTQHQDGVVAETLRNSCGQAGQCSELYTFWTTPSEPYGSGVTASNGVASFMFFVEFGKPYRLIAATGFYGHSDTGLTGSATSAINGITSLTVNSQRISYQVTSASGWNYVSAVPETSSSMLLLIGLAVLAGYSARRSRRAQI